MEDDDDENLMFEDHAPAAEKNDTSSLETTGNKTTTKKTKTKALEDSDDDDHDEKKKGMDVDSSSDFEEIPARQREAAAAAAAAAPKKKKTMKPRSDKDLVYYTDSESDNDSENDIVNSLNMNGGDIQDGGDIQGESSSDEDGANSGRKVLSGLTVKEVNAAFAPVSLPCKPVDDGDASAPSVAPVSSGKVKFEPGQDEVVEVPPFDREPSDVEKLLTFSFPTRLPAVFGVEGEGEGEGEGEDARGGFEERKQQHRERLAAPLQMGQQGLGGKQGRRDIYDNELIGTPSGKYGQITVHESGKAYLHVGDGIGGTKVFEVRGGITKGFWEIFGQINIDGDGDGDGDGANWTELGSIADSVSVEPCFEEN